MMQFRPFRPRPRRGSNRAVAAVEFAIACPVMLAFLAGVYDFGRVYYGKSCLANAVASGAEYAMVTGKTVSATTIQSVVQNVGGLKSGSTSLVSATITGPACYCVAGTSMTSTSTSPCSSPGISCTGSGTLGTYVIISATYTFTGLWSTYSGLGTKTINSTATVQLQ